MVGYFADVILVCGLILSVKRTRSMNMVGNVCAISNAFHALSDAATIDKADFITFICYVYMHLCNIFCLNQQGATIDNADCVNLGCAPLNTLSSFPAHKTTEVSSFMPAFFCNLYR